MQHIKVSLNGEMISRRACEESGTLSTSGMRPEIKRDFSISARYPLTLIVSCVHNTFIIKQS